MPLLRRVLAALPIACAVSTSLHAQRDTSRTDSVRYTLPAIGVTATRDERPPLMQPLAITRVETGQTFGTKGAGIDDALQFVPGVLAQSRNGGSDVRLVIRGFGSRGAGDRSNSGTSRGVRVLLDGVPETEPDGRTAFDNLDLGLMRGVEVVRSNASSLWGNAAGGVVSFTTLDLNDRSGGYAEAMAGSYGLRRGILRGDLPLGGRGLMALQGAYTNWDGWRDHSDARRMVFNASSSVPLGQRSRLGVLALATNNEFRIPGPLTQAQVDSAPWQANATYAARDERRHNRLARLAATLDQRWDSGMELNALAFVTPKYLQRSERNSYRDFTRYHVGASLVARMRKSLGAASHGTFVVGADEAYQDGAVLFYTLSPTQGRGDTLTSNQREGSNNAGLFAEALLDIGERWGLTLGARYDAIRYHAADYVAGLDDAKTFSRVTPKLGVTYRVGPSQSIYANVGGGVEAPAGNETDPASTFGQDSVYALNPLLEPILSTTVEVGTKRIVSGGDGFLSSLSYDVALYHTVVKNEIVPYRGGRFYFTAGEARRSGAEFGVVAQARNGFRLDGSLALSENTYASYVVDSVHYGVPGATADYSGNDIVGVPPVIWALGLGYTLRGRAPLTARIVLEGTSSYFADDANSVTVPAHGLLNLSLGSDAPIPLSRSIGVRGFMTVNNVLDRSYIASAFLNPDVVNGEPVAFEPGLPRNVVFALSLVRL